MGGLWGCICICVSAVYLCCWGGGLSSLCASDESLKPLCHLVLSQVPSQPPPPAAAQAALPPRPQPGTISASTTCSRTSRSATSSSARYHLSLHHLQLHKPPCHLVLSQVPSQLPNLQPHKYPPCCGFLSDWGC